MGIDRPDDPDVPPDTPSDRPSHRPPPETRFRQEAYDDLRGDTAMVKSSLLATCPMALAAGASNPPARALAECEHAHLMFRPRIVR